MNGVKWNEMVQKKTKKEQTRPNRTIQKNFANQSGLMLQYFL